jgi:lysophospholipase L1-like esterase
MADLPAPTQQRIFIVGDSHCRGMDDAIKKGRPHIQTLSVIFPRGTLAISSRYTATLRQINRFDPDVIFLHCGHNDLMYHPTLTPEPINSQESRKLTIDLAQLLLQNHPQTKVIISTLLPRTYKDNTALSQAEVLSFNKLAKRHGQRLRSESAALQSTIKVTLNNPIWKHISKSEERADFYRDDGLHLTNEGKLAMAASWYADICPALPSAQCTSPRATCAETDPSMT